MLWEKAIEAYLPGPLRIAEVGWHAFLTTWNDKALNLVKTVLTYQGTNPGATEEQVRYIEKKLETKMPEGVLKGTRLDYPGKTDDERRQIEELLEKVRDYYVQWHKQSSIRGYEDEIIVNDGAFRPPCPEKAIAKLEERLDATLPKSYTDFLRISNGWLLMNTYLLPVEKVDWYRNSEWFEWFVPHEELFPESVSDKDYFIYGAQQHPVKHMRKEYVRAFLSISDAISDFRGLQFLNPKVVFEDGEWEAATWFGGGFVRFRSFATMLEQLYRRDIGYKRYYISNLMRRFG